MSKTAENTVVSEMRPPDRTVNKSGLKPLAKAVLVKPYEPEFAKSVIVLPPSASERSKMVETRAIVIAIGVGCWKNESEPRAAVGDKVLISKYCGVTVQGTADGEIYRMVNDEDIYCQIVKEVS